MEFLKKEAPLITASKKLLFRHVQWQYARPIEALDRKISPIRSAKTNGPIQRQSGHIGFFSASKAVLALILVLNSMRPMTQFGMNLIKLTQRSYGTSRTLCHIGRK